MKKTLALLLALIMVVALFAGCNTTTDPTDPSTPSTPSNPTDPSDPTQTGPYPVDENGQFVYGDKFKGVVVSVAVVADEDQDDLWFFKLIEEKFGCDIQVVEIPNGAYQDKMAAYLADKNLPTIFESFGTIAQIVEYGDQGAFVNVMDEDNLAKMPHFKKFFVDQTEVYDEYMMTASTATGAHYILPAWDSERAVNHYWVYNDAEFEKAGVEWSGDTVNGGFLKMLRDLKAYNPSSWPLTAGDWKNTLQRMISTWGVNSMYAAYDYEDEKWFYGATTDEFYDIMNLLLTCYNEGLMNPASLSQGNGALQEDIINHRSYIYHSWLGWMSMHNAAFVKEGVSDHESPTPTPVGPNGMTLELKKFANSYGTVINAEDPLAAECAMAIMNWMYDDSKLGGAWASSVGPDEIVATDENGKLNWIDESSPTGYNNDVNYVAPLYGMFDTSLNVRYAPESPYFTFNAEEQLAQEIGDKIGYFKAAPALAWTDVEMADAYTASQQDIQAMTQKFITDNWTRADFDAWVADFLDQYGEVMDFLNS